jgi:hypothetical protein
MSARQAHILALPHVPVRGKKLERVMGIEPTLVAWEATVLPLNYTRARGDSM